MASEGKVPFVDFSVLLQIWIGFRAKIQVGRFLGGFHHQGVDSVFTAQTQRSAGVDVKTVSLVRVGGRQLATMVRYSREPDNTTKSKCAFSISLPAGRYCVCLNWYDVWSSGVVS